MNTWVNLCYFCVCVVILARENKEDEKAAIDDFVVALYSDDNLTTLWIAKGSHWEA